MGRATIVRASDPAATPTPDRTRLARLLAREKLICLNETDGSDVWLRE